MNFLLEVGVYILMVVFAAAGAGFVVFRLLTSGKGPRRAPKNKQGKSQGRSAGYDEDDEIEDEDTPPVAAPRVKPSKQQAPDVQETPAASPPSPATAVPSAAAKATAAATDSESVDSISENVEVQSDSNSESTEAEQQETESKATDEDNVVAPGTVQEVLAPPDERNDDDSENDAFLAMFQGGDEEENTSGAIANKVEEFALSDLLSDALQLTTTMKTRGGNDAQSK